MNVRRFCGQISTIKSMVFVCLCVQCSLETFENKIDITIDRGPSCFISCWFKHTTDVILFDTNGYWITREIKFYNTFDCINNFGMKTGKKSRWWWCDKRHNSFHGHVSWNSFFCQFFFCSNFFSLSLSETLFLFAESFHIPIVCYYVCVYITQWLTWKNLSFY